MYIQGMEECKRGGFTRSIGVSNFNIKQLQRILNKCTILPANIQVNLCAQIKQNFSKSSCIPKRHV